MDEKFSIFDIRLDGLRAKEAMEKVVEFLDGVSINSVEIVTQEILMQGQNDPEWKAQIQTIDLLLPGEREILEVAGITDKTKIRETENQVFFKMFLKYLHRNKKRVFLLTCEEYDLSFLQSAIKRDGKGLAVIGQAVLPVTGERKENVINEINGLEPDCILSFLPCPLQERFIYEAKPLLNARLWLGCGISLFQNNRGSKTLGRIRRLVLRRAFRYEALRQKNTENGNR